MKREKPKRKIVAEVWDRYKLPIPGTKPESRHYQQWHAETQANKLNREFEHKYGTNPFIVLVLNNGAFEYLPIAVDEGPIN